MENISLLPSPQVQLSELIRTALLNTDPVFDYEGERWKLPHIAARAIHGVLVRNRIDPRAYDISKLKALIDDFAMMHNESPDDFELAVECVWNSVKVGAGFGKFEFAVRLAEIDVRLPIMRAKFGSQALTRQAQIILLTISNLGGQTFLSARQMANALNCSKTQIAIILKRLTESSDLQIVEKAPSGIRKATVYKISSRSGHLDPQDLP